MEHDTSPDEADAERRLVACIEKALGGRVVRMDRQPRWRPSWDAEVDRGGETIRVHVRGDRAVGLESKPLRQEYEVLRTLEQQGIPVPKIYGWCDDPIAIVMQHVEGIAYEGGADTDPVKLRAVEDYMATLARIHQLDPALFAAAGFVMPKDAREVALAYFNLADGIYQASKDRPEPLIEFVRGWILRNIPMHRTRVSLVTADAPQFMRRDDRVAAFIDLEMATLGDPMADLASMRLRDTIEPNGDLGLLYKYYQDQGGDTLDQDVLNFHTVVNFICVPMISQVSLRAKHPHPAFVEYLSWSLSGNRCALAAIADRKGMTLDPVPMVPSKASDQAFALEDLVAHCADMPQSGFFRQHPVLSLALYAQQVQAIGGTIEEAELDELEPILGYRPADRETADADLEHFVMKAGADADEMLVRYFHTREMRRFQLLIGYPSPIIERGLADVSKAFAASPESALS